MKIRRILYSFLLTILFTLVVFGVSDDRVRAAAVSAPEFHFEIGSSKISSGTEYELKQPLAYIYVVDKDGVVPSTVSWDSTNTDVVSLEPTANAYSVKMVRNGPGYASITATINYDGLDYIINFTVKVNLEIDHPNTKTVIATTTGSRILVLDTIGQKKQVFVKYLDYTEDDASTVTGSAITVSSLYFESDNTGVATVDENGYVTSVGAGSANITVTSATMSSTDKQLSVNLRVVVSPDFNISYSVGSSNLTLNAVDDDSDPSGIYQNVPSDFTIYSNATKGDNLVWVVKRLVGNKKTKISEGTSTYMTYTINDSGTVSFQDIKAGTYEIYAFTNSDYDEDANAPYSYMKIYVPISFDSEIIMNVGDEYNLLEFSNIPDKDIFIEPSGYDSNIAYFDSSNYTISAKRNGTVDIHLVYDTGQKVFEGITVSDMTITVKVIDGISLSTSKATIYTKGTLQLEATVTDNTSVITWTSSDKSTATVVNGLVTGIKKGGPVTITAQQTINGVVKKATCKIWVQDTVSSITIDPASKTLAIGSYVTLYAKITPALENISLKWRSSNEKVVKIVDLRDLSATIQGVSGGTAVISAINQDNVVVGYCEITVNQPVTSLVLSETSVTVSLAVKKLQLRATVYPTNAENQTVVWSSTDTSKATVDQNGLVTLIKPGTVTISATSDDNPKIVQYCTIDISIPVVSIALDTTTRTMYAGESAKITYTLLPTNASNTGVSWVSTNTAVAAVDTSGRVTARAAGTAVIILRTSDGGYSAYCTITVKQVATTVRFDVTTLNLKTGEYYVIKTTLTPNGSTENDLVWESSDTKIATVDTEGKVTAKSSGTAIIMARTEAGGVAYCTVKVTQAVKGLVLNFSQNTIFIGNSLTLEASVTPSNATVPDVTWKSSNPQVATITNKGVVKGISGGITVITCTTKDGGYAATCIITVKESVTTITLNYESYKLGIKKTVKLIGTVTSDTATNKKVKWISSNENIAVVNASGKVTGLKAGYATITAVAQDGSEVEASCEIRVIKLVTDVELDKSAMSMFEGESKKLKATVTPKTATYKKVNWSSSDPSVAIVDDNGKVIGIKGGTAMITAEALDDTGKKAICYVTVNTRVAATGITLADKKITMVAGESKIVNMVLMPAAATDSVTWSSDNTAVASVSKTSGKITAKATGTAYITVMTESGKTATVEVTVIGLNITKLTTEEYTTYSQVISVEGASETVTWKSSNPLVAVIYSDGTISTRGVGTATITATVNGRKLTCKITVKKQK